MVTDRVTRGGHIYRKLEYTYVSSNPLRLVDLDGMQGSESTQQLVEIERPPITGEQVSAVKLAWAKGFSARLAQEGLREYAAAPSNIPGSGLAFRLVNALVDTGVAETYGTDNPEATSWNPFYTMLGLAYESNETTGLALSQLKVGNFQQAERTAGRAGYQFGGSFSAIVQLATIVTGGAKLATGLLESGKRYIVYIFRNKTGQVVYVGKASGTGTPMQILKSRIGKPHEHFNPAELTAEPLLEASSNRAVRAAEGAFQDHFAKLAREGGYKMLNNDPALGKSAGRLSKSFGKFEEYSQAVRAGLVKFVTECPVANKLLQGVLERGGFR